MMYQMLVQLLIAHEAELITLDRETTFLIFWAMQLHPVPCKYIQ